MAPISPLQREESPSTDNLKGSSESLEDRGVCNEGFDDKDPESKSPDDPSQTEKTETATSPKEDPLTSPPLNQSSQSSGNLGKSGHSRVASATSSGLPVNHSRGASTDGSVIEPYTPSVTESRRGTYSEAGTLPIGMMTQEGTPIMEENGSSIEISEKQHNGFGSDHNAVSSKSHWNTMNKFTRPILKKNNPLPPDPSTLDRIKYAFSCPPHGTFGKSLSMLMLLLLFWGTLVGIAGDMALPGGTLFSLLILVVTAQAAGVLVSKVRLPPLLGMLVVGIMYRSIGPIKIIGESIDNDWSSTLRSVALVVILIRAGLGLDPDALRRLSFVVLRLAATPCLVEACTVAVMSHFLLEFPWKWGFMLGFVLAAVSPAVVVPCLLSLEEQGYGKGEGIPTLVIAAASIDDVIAISGFGITLGITFSEGSPLWQGMKGPLEFLIGVCYGILIGVILWLLPNKKDQNTANLRFFLLLASGMFAIFGSKIFDMGGAGALGCLCIAFVAGIGWKKRASKEDVLKIKANFNMLWQFFQPMLFGLIGAQIDVSNLDPNTIGLGIACLVVGLSLRVITSFFAVAGGGLNLKERFFVALAWLPKATVQAAIGSTALDLARAKDGDPNNTSPEEQLGIQVLTIAVLVILITAPIGSAAIMLSAPKLLKRKIDDPSEDVINA